MKKNWIIILLIPIIFLTGCISNRNSDTNRAIQLEDEVSKAGVAIDQNNIELGEIPIAGGTVDVTFAFRNDGSQPIIINGAQTSCMCTEAVIKSSDGKMSPRIKMPGHGPLATIIEVLEPGEEAQLIATYDPMAHGPNGLGPIKRDVVLSTNSEVTPEVKFTFQGVVVR